MISLGLIKINARQFKIITNENTWRFGTGYRVRCSEYEPEKKRFIVQFDGKIRVVMNVVAHEFTVEATEELNKNTENFVGCSIWVTVANGTFGGTNLVDPYSRVTVQVMEAIATVIDKRYREEVWRSVLALPFVSEEGETIMDLGRAAELAVFAARNCKIFRFSTEWLLCPVTDKNGHKYAKVMCVYPKKQSETSLWLPPYEEENEMSWASVWNRDLGDASRAVEIMKPLSPIPIRTVYDINRIDEYSSARERIHAMKEEAIVKNFQKSLSKFFTMRTNSKVVDEQ